MQRCQLLAAAVVSMSLAACDSPSAPRGTPTYLSAPIAEEFVVVSGPGELAPSHDGSCTFDRGTTTCVTTAQYTETSSHTEYSGCLAGPPPNFRPGSRQRTFSDTYLVTVTTTTEYRGKSEHAYDSNSSTTRQLVSSTLVSDVCSAI